MTAKSQRKRAAPVKKQSIFNNKGMKYGLIIVAIAIVVIVAIYVNLNLSSNNNNEENDENPFAVIETSMGTIKVELYQDEVPNTCKNFIKLANDGFYDGLVFHRIIDNFMIQGGGFYADGTYKESPYDPIDLEINPEVRHVDGAIAMARTSDPNSATSQFFIDDGDQPQLEPGGVDPNGYAAFGVVIDGMDVVREISSVDTTSKYGAQDWPIDDVTIISITIE